MKRFFVFFGLVALTAATLALASQSLRSTTPAAQADFQSTTDFRKPHVVLKETEYDLGVIDPGDKCRRIFIVRNDGEAPLKISKAATSCKCTVSMVPSKEIPPGKGGPIEIESKTDDAQGRFSHTAGFLTNDPQNPRIELTIKGEIRTFLAAAPSAVALNDLKRGEPVEITANIISEAWEKFTMTNPESNIDGLTWNFQSMPYKTVRELNENGKSGYVATFRLPADRKKTDFAGFFAAEARADNKNDKPRALRLSLSGKAAAIRTVYGPQVDPNGVVAIGTLNQGEGARANLLLQVRGKHRELRIQNIRKSPDFMKVSVQPETPELAKKGLYKIVVEIPPDAPVGNFMPPRTMGQLSILTDHPEMPEIVKLDVAFVVIGQ